MKTAAVTSWVRWLAHCGLTPDHIARVLDCPAGDVERALAPRVHGKTRWHMGPGQVAEMRRLRREGLTYRGIGERMGIPGQAANDLLRGHAGSWRPTPRPPRPPDAARPRVGGVTGTRFRRLLEMGYEPGRAAELLQLDALAVDDLVERMTRRQRHRRAQDPLRLNRPRVRKEQSALCDWDRILEPESEPPPIVDALPVRPAIAPAMPTPCEGWGHVQAAETHRRKLDEDDVHRLWELREGGLSRRELADAFGVSVATVGRLIKAGPPAAPAEGDEPPPATSADGPQPHRWREPRGNRGRAWRDD